MFRHGGDWKYRINFHETRSEITLLRRPDLRDLCFLIFHRPLYNFSLRSESCIVYIYVFCPTDILHSIWRVIKYFIKTYVTFQTVIDTLFLCICEDKNLNGENGKWRQSALVQFGSSSNIANGQHELAPINE